MVSNYFVLGLAAFTLGSGAMYTHSAFSSEVEFHQTSDGLLKLSLDDESQVRFGLYRGDRHYHEPIFFREYNLSSASELEELIEYLNRWGILNENIFELSDYESFISECFSRDLSYSVPSLDSNFLDDVLDILEVQSNRDLKLALPTSLRSSDISPQHKIIDLRLRGENIPLRLQFHGDVDLISVEEINGSSKKLQEIGLKIEKRNDLEPTHYIIRSIGDEGSIKYIFRITQTPADALEVLVAGRLDRSSLLMEGFESNLYFLESPSELSTRGNRLGQIFGVTSRRESLDKGDDGQQIYNFGQRVRVDGSAGEDSYDFEVSAGPRHRVTGALFRTVYGSTQRRHHKIKEEISAEAKKAILSNPEFAELIDESEFDNLVHEISMAVKDRTEDYSIDFSSIQSVATEESLLHFSKFLTQKMVINSLSLNGIDFESLSSADQLKVDRILSEAIGPFESCLERASSRRNLEAMNLCMERYEIEGPIAIGRNLLGINLSENGLGDYEHFYFDQYDRCIQRNIRAVDQINDVQSEVTRCVYAGFIKTIDYAIGFELDRNRIELGLNRSLSSSEIELIKRAGRSCFRESGYLTSGVLELEINYDYLLTVSPEDFEKDVLECVNDYTYEGARELIALTIQQELEQSLGDQISIEQKNQVIQFALDQGHTPCKDMQLEVIREKGIEHSYSPEICDGIIESLATVEGFKLVLSNLFLEEERPRFEIQFESDYAQCFDQAIVKSFEQLRTLLVENRYSDESKKTINTELEREVYSCAMPVIIETSREIAKNEVISALDELVADEGLTLREESLDGLASEVALCMDSFLSNFNSLDEFSRVQDEVVNSCSLAMLNSSAAREQLITPIIISSLASAGLSDEELETYSDFLVEQFYRNSIGVSNLDEFMGHAENFKSDAVLLLVERILSDQIAEALGDDASSSDGLAFIEMTVHHLDHELLGKQGYREKLIFAANSDDSSLIAEVVESFTLDASSLVVERVLGWEGAKLVRDELLSEDSIEIFVSQGSEVFKECLSERVSLEIQERLEFCQTELKKSSTEWVIVENIMNHLSDPEVSVALDGHDIDEIISEILDSNVKREIASLSLSTSTQQDLSMDDLINRITDRSLRVIGPIVLNFTLRETLNLKEGADDPQLIHDVNIKLEECFDEMSAQYCLNQARARVSYQLVEDLFLPLIPMIQKPNDERPRQFITRRLGRLESCIDDVDLQQDLDSYEKGVNFCLITGITYTIDDLVRWLEGELNREGVLENPYDLQVAWGECRKDLVRNYSDLDRFQSSLTECGIGSLLPTILRSVGRGLPSTLQELDVWSDKEAYLFELVIDNLAETIEFTPSVISLFLKLNQGKEVDIERNTIARSSRFVNENDTFPSEIKLEESVSFNLWSLLEDGIPLFGESINGLLEFTGPGLEVQIRTFFLRIGNEVSRAERQNEDLNIEELGDIIFSSDLVDYFIQYAIATQLNIQAGQALENFISDEEQREELVEKLSSPRMIQSLFNLRDPEVQDLFNRVKSDFLIEALQGNRSDIPEDIMYDIQLRLASDTRIGGFAETLMAPIVQEQLTEARETFTASMGRLFGVVKSQDFEWGRLKSREGADRVITIFSDELLVPIMTGQEMSNKEREEAEKLLEEEITRLVRRR